MALTQADLLMEIDNEVRKCHKCPLSKFRRNPVPGEGKIDAEIMLIGEAPGYFEDQQGKPFVGAAGKFLNELLAQAGIFRADVYVTNIIKCRPPNNREPTATEVKVCTPYLDRQIECISPKVIITLGSHAASYIFQKYEMKFDGITKIHGKIYTVSAPRVKALIPMFHPASALYSIKYREELMKDFSNLKFKLKELL